MTAYTTPSTLNINDLVSDSIYNDQLVNNIKHLHEAINSIVVLEHQAASGTSAGDFTSGAWQTRTLNTEVVDVNNVCALSSNQFTLEAGTYEIRWWAGAFRVDKHQTRIQNATDATTIALGMNSASDQLDSGADTVEHTTISAGATRFTIAAGKALELQHRCQTTSAGAGARGSASSWGTEVYAQVWLRKVA